MRVNEIMSRVPSFLRMEQPVLQAAQLMRDEDVGFLPVCDADTKVIGAITDRDIVLRIVADERSSSTAVRDVMSSEVVTVVQTEDVSRAEELMEENQVARLVCVDENGALVGVVGVADLARRDGDHVREVVTGIKADQHGAAH